MTGLEDEVLGKTIADTVTTLTNMSQIEADERLVFQQVGGTTKRVRATRTWLDDGKGC